MRNCASGNLEIPGSRFARPGMTAYPATFRQPRRYNYRSVGLRGRAPKEISDEDEGPYRDIADRIAGEIGSGRGGHHARAAGVASVRNPGKAKLSSPGLTGRSSTPWCLS